MNETTPNIYLRAYLENQTYRDAYWAAEVVGNDAGPFEVNVAYGPLTSVRSASSPLPRKVRGSRVFPTVQMAELFAVTMIDQKLRRNYSRFHLPNIGESPYLITRGKPAESASPPSAASPPVSPPPRSPELTFESKCTAFV